MSELQSKPSRRGPAWLRPAATGLFAGAAAVAALAISRPEVQPPPVWGTAPAFSMPGILTPPRPATRPTTLPMGDFIVGFAAAPPTFAEGAGPDLRGALDSTLDHYEVEKVSAEDALKRWSIQSGANLAVDWPGLERAGFNWAAPVTLDLHAVPAGQVLRLLLDRLGETPLDAFADGDVLRVAGEVDVRRRSVVKMYDVSRLVLADLAFDDRRPGSPLNGKTRTKSVDDIIQAIQSMISRDSWTENGGDVGSVKELNGWLIVSQTPEVHAQIGRFLTEYLRRQRLRLRGGS